MQTTLRDHHQSPLAPTVVHHTFAPCPVARQLGPGGWVLDAADGPWFGSLAPTINAILKKPTTRLPPLLPDHLAIDVQVGSWDVRLAADGAIVARHADGTILPVPLILTRSKAYGFMRTTPTPAPSTGGAIWDAVDAPWCANALDTIRASLEGTTFTRIGDTPTPGSWALWWTQGSWARHNHWEHTIDEACRYAAALLDPGAARAEVRVAFNGSRLLRNGRVLPADVHTSGPCPSANQAVHDLLAPMLGRTGAVYHHWNQDVAPFPRQGATRLLDTPIFGQTRTLPAMSAHQRLVLRHHLTTPDGALSL